MTGTPLHSVSVAGVAFDDEGRVLVIQRRDNEKWQAPGGILELEESFEQGVVREVLEETNVEVDVGRLTGVYKNVSLSVVSLVYRCSVRRGNPAPTSESIRVAWLPVTRAVELMSPAFGIRVLDAQAGGSAVPSRIHDGVQLLPSTRIE